MALGMEVGLGPCHIVLDRDPAKLSLAKRICNNPDPSLIGQELLESLLLNLLCSVEFDLLKAIDDDTVYCNLSLKSSVFRELMY